MSISKYEHLKEVQIQEDPRRPLRTRSQTSRDRPLKRWKTIRRRDERIFLAREIEDISKISEEIKESLLRLLNHPNLVNLIDIVSESRDGGYDFTVWEYCDLGSLSHLIDSYQELGQRRIPEKICWNVLSGISDALHYLHNGANQPFGSIAAKRQELDWQPITMVDINPTNIFFSSLKGTEPYGNVKLGGFGSAVISSFTHEGETPDWIRNGYSPYMPPEIYNRPNAAWSTKADIWALGAVLYSMMTGKPPRPIKLQMASTTTQQQQQSTTNSYVVTQIPPTYSFELREIVYDMILFNPKDRLTAELVCMRVDFGWERAFAGGTGLKG